jgi:hypothetical protein
MEIQVRFLVSYIDNRPLDKFSQEEYQVIENIFRTISEESVTALGKIYGIF